jgi:tetratricopeptide (TPR) repeat protein
LSQAAEAYSAALALKPDLARAHFQLAKVLAAQGDKAGAATHFRDAANGTDSAIGRQAEQALRDLGIR